MAPAANAPISIRPMRLEDLPEVERIDKASFSLPWPPSAYRYELNENRHSMLFVAEDQTDPAHPRVVGHIVIWFIVDEAHIASIAVHPDYRGRGIGQHLIARSLQETIRKGFQVATLEVRENNLTAQKLYQRFGFEVVGRRFRYYRDNNEDALIMTISTLDDQYLAWLESGAWASETP
ncbi:MAG: ribosomal protein S18-alanine N-acetyltransferase [Chloroflexi bacterium]|jgi:ribosomal-protein-alanine N-acetyltransferase|nr:ribosomal protein S18-alanine N-acetyltransferase [Chloroflexota bacterium]